jgi:hypothetical protein
MNKKALTSFCILTLLAVVFVSFLLITVGHSQTQSPKGCKIWPDAAAARLEHCSQCIEDLNNEINAYCPKDDCDCMQNWCDYWKQYSKCSSIHVCGGVCQDKTRFDQYCVVPTPAGASVTKCGFGCSIFGTAGAGGFCTVDNDCTNKNCNSITHTCAFSGLFEPCGYDSDCGGDLICCNNGKCIVSEDLNRDCAVNIVDIANVALKWECSDKVEDQYKCRFPTDPCGICPNADTNCYLAQGSIIKQPQSDNEWYWFRCNDPGIATLTISPPESYELYIQAANDYCPTTGEENHDPNQVSIDVPVPGGIYYVLVHRKIQSSGNFAIRLDCERPG